MTDEQDRQQKYLYCIIQGADGRAFEAEAIGGRGDAVQAVVNNGNDLAMVVSDSPDKKYEGTRANMVAHESVIERVMGEGFTVLPVRFGTVTRNASETPVEDIRHKVLTPRAEEFYGLLDEMDNKVELGVKAVWRDEKAIFEELVAENGGIRKTRDALLGRSAESTHWQRMNLGERVKNALDSKREVEAKQLLRVVRPLTFKDREHGGVRENKILMQRMILNSAFLVDRSREGEFDEAMKRLDEELGERMVFKYSGPNPPFNFVEIVVNWEEEE